MKKTLLIAMIFVICGSTFAAEDTKASERVQAAATVLDEIMGTADKAIPEEVLKSAECVAVVPSLLKGGFVVGARYGRGLASCRTEKGWSAPGVFLQSAAAASVSRLAARPST